MATGTMKVPMARLMKDVSVRLTVTGVPTWRARVTVGTWLIKVAAAVMGLPVHIEMKEGHGDR